MALGFLSSLFGCSQAKDHGSWTCFIVSNLSPDRLDSYSFRVNVSDDGEMTLYGYCYDEENEYRWDEGVNLSMQTADKLRQMEIEKLPVQKPKRKFWRGEVVDDVERVAQVTFEDGAELGVILANEQRAAIVSILSGELIAARCTEMHGEWDKLWLSFTSDNYSEGYDFEVSRKDAGEWIAVGYCSDEEYNRYESENGIILSAETIEAIRALKPERYAAVRKAEQELDGVTILDGSSGGLTLGYTDGYTEEKATPQDVDYAISVLLKKEFAEKADKQ